MKFLRNLSKKNVKIDLEKTEALLNTNWKFILIGLLVFICLTGIAALAAFFITLRSPEEVLVPNVEGKELTVALQEMQVKELFPKIQMQYSSSNEDEGLILSQSPSGGAIVKAGKRITLTVSQGAVLDRVGDYVGMNIEDLRVELKALFSSSTPMIQIPEVIMYKEDTSAPGTILEQNPPANTSLSHPVTLELVVSSGQVEETATVPDLVGLSLNDALLQLNRNKLIFVFSSQDSIDEEDAGIILSQSIPGGQENIPAFTRIDAVISIPSEVVDGLAYGLLEQNLPIYPYALQMELQATPLEGNPYSIITFEHTGGLLTIPYAVQPGTTLRLTAQGNEVYSFIVP